MAEKVKMKVNIAGRFYPMSVNPDEEEVIRFAGKQINEMIADFESKYDVRDKQDALAMCALQFVAKSTNQVNEGANEDEQLKEKLRLMIDDLQKQLT